MRLFLSGRLRALWVEPLALDGEKLLHLVYRRRTVQLRNRQTRYVGRRLIGIWRADHQLLARFLDKTGLTERGRKRWSVLLNELETRTASTRGKLGLEQRQPKIESAHERSIWNSIVEKGQVIGWVKEQRKAQYRDGLVLLVSDLTEIGLQSINQEHGLTLMMRD